MLTSSSFTATSAPPPAASVTSASRAGGYGLNRERMAFYWSVYASHEGDRSHPLAAVSKGYDRFAPVYLADYATADDGTGIVESLYVDSGDNQTQQLVHDDFGTDVYAVFGQVAYDRCPVPRMGVQPRADGRPPNG